MRVALYARVSTDGQEARGTVGSQIDALRSWAGREGHVVIREFVDDGYSGSRLDRPGLDALRDGAEAGLFTAVLCLTPDRLARAYAYQFLVLEELTRHGVRVLFRDAPPLDDDPQARLLVQMQGVIAEYERAKIAERHRRGKLFRARAGEVFWRLVPYGYRRIGHGSDGPGHLEIFEPEAAVVRRAFDDYVAGGYSIRQIVRRLYEDNVPSPGGKPLWSHTTLSGVLRNQAYSGTLFYNQTEMVHLPISGSGARRTRQQARPREEWIPISIPPIISQDIFEAAHRRSRDNCRFSPRHTTTEAWLLRGLLVCGSCAVRVNCNQQRARNGTFHRYYRCPNHDPIRARGEERRCPERQMRADELDEFVFEQVRSALLRPEVLLRGEAALAGRIAPNDELLNAQLTRLARRLAQADAERARLFDLYQAGLMPMAEVQRRGVEIADRQRQYATERENLVAQRHELAVGNRLWHRVTSFAQRVTAGMAGLDFKQRQRLVRLLLEDVRVQGWSVEIRFRISLDEGPEPDPHPPPSRAARTVRSGPVSTDVRLRTLGAQQQRLASAVGAVRAFRDADRRRRAAVRPARLPRSAPARALGHDERGRAAPPEAPLARGWTPQGATRRVAPATTRGIDAPAEWRRAIQP
jgi:site-specific DNA recombinase